MGRWLRQTATVTLLNLRMIRERKGASSAAAVGIAGVVAVFVAILSIGVGFRRTLAGTGSPDTALVLRSGSDSEMMSGLRHDDTRVIADGPGVERGHEGSPGAPGVVYDIDSLPN